MEQCDGCGFVFDDVPVRDIAERVRSFGPRYGTALRAHSGPDGERQLRQRPAAETWSAVEYACHIRDVLLAQRERIMRVLFEDCPTFPLMHRDERVAVSGYAEEAGTEAAAELEVASNLASRVFASLRDEHWQRRCIYPFPTPTERTLAWLGRQTVHEGEHHLMDLNSALGLARRPGPAA